MFVVIAKAKVQPDKIELYESTFKDLRKKVLANEPGIKFYELSRVPDEPGSYRLVEAYADKETQDDHLTKDYYQAVVPTIMGCLVDNTFEMEVVETI